MTILPWILILSLFFIHKFYSLQYYSNFNDGKLLFGIESTIVDYVTLANDPKEKLPNDFTICTSLYIKYMTTKNNIFELYKEDGSHWFQMDIEHLRDIDSFSERVSMFYESTLNKFWDKTVTIIPHSWYHVCLGLDTDSGHLRLVVNGNVLVDEVKEFFVQTSNLKPTSLAGKLLGIVENKHIEISNCVFSFQDLSQRLLVSDQEHLQQHQHLRINDWRGANGEENIRRRLQQSRRLSRVNIL